MILEEIVTVLLSVLYQCFSVIFSVQCILCSLCHFLS